LGGYIIKKIKPTPRPRLSDNRFMMKPKNLSDLLVYDEDTLS
jgi:hypothetical protein